MRFSWDGSPAERRVGFTTGCLAGMDRRPNAARVSLQAVWPGWIAARTPPGFHHRLFTPLQPATAGTPASDRRRCPKRRETAYRRSPAEAARRQSPEESGENPPQQNHPPPTFVPIRGVPPRENRTFERLRRPPARRAEPGTRRTAARLSPTPERRRRPEVRRLFSPLQSVRPPGRGSVWQSTWFGIRGSQVQILPPRRGPSPPDGFRPQGGPEAALASGCFGRIFPAPSHPGSGRSFRHSPMAQNVYILALLPKTFVPASALFLALAS